MLRSLKRFWPFAAKPSAIDLAHAIGLPPEKAVAYFKSKGFKFSFDWHEVYQEAHNSVFTVAKVAKLDLLQDIHGVVQKTFTEGKSERNLSRELEIKLKAKGWWGRQKVINPQGIEQEVQLGSPWRIKTILRTNAQTGYAAGRWQQFEESKETHPYLQFVCIVDKNTRPDHLLLHLKVFRFDDPIWQTMTPPLDWGCRCRIRALSEDDLAELGLKVSSSEGLLHKEERLISETTGEMQPVTVYTDPKSGKTVSTEPGFDYNPGMKAYERDLSKYDPDLVREFQKERDTDA